MNSNELPATLEYTCYRGLRLNRSVALLGDTRDDVNERAVAMAVPKKRRRYAQRLFVEALEARQLLAAGADSAS